MEFVEFVHYPECNIQKCITEKDMQLQTYLQAPFAIFKFNFRLMNFIVNIIRQTRQYSLFHDVHHAASVGAGRNTILVMNII